MLTGENGILKKAGNAKDLTEVAQEKEEISLVYNSLLIDKMQKENNSITTVEFDKAIKSYDPKATVASERDKMVVTFSNGHKYTVSKNGTTDEYIEPPVAKDKLTVTVEGKSVESPYYVNYPSAKGTIKCRVLYNDDTYGLQIISVNPVTRVTLGKDDSNTNLSGEMGSLERAQNSYNMAITMLNKVAEEYIATSDGSILATDARCVGSDPLNKNFPENLEGNERAEEMYIADDSYAYMKDYNGKNFKTDNHYSIDSLRLGRIGAKKITDTTNGDCYYYASHRVSLYNNRCNFCIPLQYNDGIQIFNLWAVKEDGTNEYGNYIGGIRPVFTLSSEVKIIDGEGTEEIPFEIGL